MKSERSIGYIGVDILNNATVCNEASGLLAAGVRLEPASVYRVERATFYRDESWVGWSWRIHHLYPLNWFTVICDLLSAPWVFGWRFWSTLLGAITCPSEGLKQRLRICGQVIPALQLAHHWRRKNVGHVHAQWAHSATTIAMHTASLLGVGFSFTGHANDLFVHRVGLRGKVNRARFIVAISEFHRRFYLELGALPERLQVVYCGIDLHRFREERPRPLADGGRRIVSVGSLVEKKGARDLIKACALLRDRGIDFQCVLAGSGPQEGELWQLINHLKLGDRVQLTGREVLQEDLPELLSSSRVMVLPCIRDRNGNSDGLPPVLIEAMACGVPTISTRLVGIPDLIRPGKTGFLVKPGDIRGLADAMTFCFEHTSETDDLGEACAAWASAHFGRDEAVHRLKTLLGWAASTPGMTFPPLHYSGAPGAEAEYQTGNSLVVSERSPVLQPAGC